MMMTKRFTKTFVSLIVLVLLCRVLAFQIQHITSSPGIINDRGTRNRCSSYTTVLPSFQSSFSSCKQELPNQLQMSTKPIPTSTSTSASTSPTKKKRKRRRKPSVRNKREKVTLKPLKDPSAIQTWRIFGIEVNPDSLGESAIILKKNKDTPSIPIERIYLSQPVLESLLKRLKIDGIATIKDSKLFLPPQLKDVRMVRRSLDARKKFVLGQGPRYTYVVDIDLTAQSVRDLRLKNQPGRNEIVTPDMEHDTKHINSIESRSGDDESTDSEKKKVIIVGAGPAGLFCALSLAQSGKVIPILLERGQPVESRGKDIGALIHRKTMNSESNFAFGEGGAGTWSDGKLTTRIGRNSKNVRKVLETFVEFGAPEKILVDGSPHLGTDNLVKLLRNMRTELRELGGQVLFGAKMTKVIENEDRIIGVQVEYSLSHEKQIEPTRVEIKEEGSTENIIGDAVVLATGHSARDVYEDLHRLGIKLEPKGFAAGFRVEHPQKVINKIQYGENWGRNAYSGKAVTDNKNQEYFESRNSDNDVEVHNGRLPVPSYRLATDKAFDGENNRGAYSFCMCPGGQIVSFIVHYCTIHYSYQHESKIVLQN